MLIPQVAIRLSPFFSQTVQYIIDAQPELIMAKNIEHTLQISLSRLFKTKFREDKIYQQLMNETLIWHINGMSYVMRLEWPIRMN